MLGLVQSLARSLVGSSTPPNRAYIWIARSGPASAMAVDNDDSSEDESSIEIPQTHFLKGYKLGHVPVNICVIRSLTGS
ncbi:hypothetical protein Tco_0789864 [Tanacetum coccineum]